MQHAPNTEAPGPVPRRIQNPLSYEPPDPKDRIEITDETAARLAEIVNAKPELHLVQPVNGIFSLVMASGQIRTCINLGIPQEMNRACIYAATSDFDLERVATFMGTTHRETKTGIRYQSLGSGLLMQTQNKDGSITPRILPPWIVAKSDKWLPAEQAASDQIVYLQDATGRLALGIVDIVMTGGQIDAEIICGPPGKFLPVRAHSADARSQGGAK